MKIQVECYSGHKADERPVKFWLGDVVLFVESVEDQWYGPDDAYFRARADDGNTIITAHPIAVILRLPKMSERWPNRGIVAREISD